MNVKKKNELFNAGVLWALQELMDRGYLPDQHYEYAYKDGKGYILSEDDLVRALAGVMEITEDEVKDELNGKKPNSKCAINH